LGKGGMGIVHRVWHKIWKMDIAVKSPLEKIINTESGLESFIREANTWVELGLHPHIVSCYYVRVLGKIPRVFVEYIDGGSLKDWILDGRLYEGGKKKALERILDIAIQSARGLDFAHSHKLVHKDIKPANIMISNNGLVKVTDFGIAGVKAILSTGDSFRSDGQSVYVGNAGYTPEYCSREQASGKSITRMTDIWSWGLCILEMFTGERTWSSGIAAEMALDDYLSNNDERYLSNNDERQNLENRKPPMPDKLTSLLKKCFQQEPTSRFANMELLENELISIYSQLTGNEFTRKKIKAVELKADELNNRAVSYLDLGREDKATECWKEALKTDAHHLESTFNFGYYRWQKAEITCDELVKQMDAIKLANQNNPDYLLSLGWIHYERGDVEAINEIQNTENKITDEKFLKVINYKERPIGKRQFEGHTECVNSVSFSPDGLYAISSSDDDTIQLWDIYTGKVIRKFEGHTHCITAVSFSPDGLYALSGSYDKTIRMWDIKSGKEIRKFEGHTNWINSVCFSPDGRYALSGSDDVSIRLWEIYTGKGIRKFEGHTDDVNSVSFSSDGRNVLSGSKDETIRLWDIQTGKEIRKFDGHTSYVNSVCFSPDGRYVLSGSDDVTIRLWDIKSGKEIRKFEGHTEAINCVSFSPEGRYALSGSGEDSTDKGKDDSIRLWEVESGKEIKKFEEHTKSVKSVCFSFDGRYALSGSDDNTLRLWGMYLPEKNFDNNFPILNKIKTTSDIITHEEIITEEFNKIKIFLNEKRYTEAYKIIEELQRSSDYERSPDLLFIKHHCCTESGFKRKQIRNVWSKNILAGHTDSVTTVCISQDVCYALSASRDKTIRLWDIKWDNNTVKEIRKFEGHTDAVNSVCISPDGRYAISGSDDKTIRMWYIQSGKEIKKFEGHSDVVNSVNFFPDGRHVLSGSDDKTIRMWNIETGKEIRKFDGHTSYVNSVCFSPDGRYVLSGSHDVTIRLWDIKSGKDFGTSNQGKKSEISVDILI
ncbi:MAG: protein kinase, partial [Ignavibacteriae bacterium]|nr:protein kinase [Ignavibacteriota bacterium]